MCSDSNTPRPAFRRVNLLHAHGSWTNYLYNYYGCRCQVCHGAHTEYWSRYRATHRGYLSDYERDVRRPDRIANPAKYRKYMQNWHDCLDCPRRPDAGDDCPLERGSLYCVSTSRDWPSAQDVE